MELTNKKLKIATGILAILTVLSVAGNIYYWNRINTLNTADDQNTDDSEISLFSQNQDIDRLKEQATEAENQNRLLEDKIQDLNKLLSQANNQVWELRTRKSDPVGDLFPAEVSTNFGSSDENATNRRYDQLNAEFTKLQDSLKQLVTHTLTSDDFRMVAFKHNSKETAKAKKVDKLTISFKVPAAYQLPDNETVFLNISDQNGNGISSPLETRPLPGPDGKKPVQVHSRKVVDFSRNPNWQEITFNIQGKDINPGTYRASVYTKDYYLGTVEVQFRDSFWFF